MLFVDDIVLISFFTESSVRTESFKLTRIKTENERKVSNKRQRYIWLVMIAGEDINNNEINFVIWEWLYIIMEKKEKYIELKHQH